MPRVKEVLKIFVPQSLFEVAEKWHSEVEVAGHHKVLANVIQMVVRGSLYTDVQQIQSVEVEAVRMLYEVAGEAQGSGQSELEGYRGEMSTLLVQERSRETAMPPIA